MRTLEIQQGTPAILLIQDKDVDVTTENYSVRKNLSYTDEHVLVDPAKFAALKNTAYERDSMAARLAADNYFVFSDVENAESRYMLAVPACDVRIS